MCCHFSSAVDKQLVCNLGSSDQTRWFGDVVSLEIFLFVCHAFRLLPVRSVNVIISSYLLLFSAAIILISSLSVSRSCYQRGCSCTASCMPHIALRLLRYTGTVVSSTPPWYMFSQCHTYGIEKPLVVLWSRVNFINKDINVYCVSTPVCLPQVQLSFEYSTS